MLAALGFQCVCKRAQAKNMNKWNEKWASTNVAFRCLVRRWDRRSEIFRLHKIRLRFVYIRAIARNPLKIREIIKSNKIAQESAVFSKIKNPIMNLGPIRLPDWNHRSTIEKKSQFKNFNLKFNSEMKQKSFDKEADLNPHNCDQLKFVRPPRTLCGVHWQSATVSNGKPRVFENSKNYWRLIFELSCT